MTEAIFQQYVIIISFSLIGVLLLRRLRMATIVAYMIVGALIGPHAFGFISAPENFSFIAEFGVVFLLFALGLEFNPRKLFNMRNTVFGVGGFQVLVCSLVFFGAVYLWGAGLSAAIMIAGSLALSSTAIVTRELSNNHQLHNLHGQLSIGVLLFQDLVAVIFLVLVPVLAAGGGESLGSALGGAAINATLVIVVLLVAGYWVLPVIYREVAKAGSEEIFVLTTLVIVVLAAWFSHALHLSMPLGAFVIGMMLGEGPIKYQIESDIRPFRDILLGLFFVTIGMNLDLGMLSEYWVRILAFTAALILFKAAAAAVVVNLLGYSPRDATIVGLNLAQAGEFGLALLSLALTNNILPPDQASFIILIAIFSMMASPFLIRHADELSRRLFPGEYGDRKTLPVETELTDHVVIGGFGRLGSLLVKFLEQNQVPYVAIDSDIDVVDRQRREGKNIVFGNSNNLEIMRLCHLSTARLVVLTFKSLEEGKHAIGQIRNRNPDIPIIVRCQEHQHYEELIDLGASLVIPEVLESSLLITRQVLDLLDIEGAEIDAQVKAYLETMNIPSRH
ncbi:MAG: cation:proton antiporter [Pseudohongiellaceae bacterium]